MWRTKNRDAVPAGEIRGEFGLALDKLLPKPELRHRFRIWRHTRPFWPGVFVIVSGLVIISYPLGPWPAMMAIGASALTGIVIGLVLITGGLFFWFSPHQRSFVSIILMLCSVLSFVASNLGGFFLGMILGMIGSAWGFGWKQPKAIPPRPTPRSPSSDSPSGSHAADGSHSADSADGSPSADSTSDSPSPTPSTRSSGRHAAHSPSSKTAGAFVAVAMLAATFVVTGQSNIAQAADRPLGRAALPSVGCGSTPVTASSLAAKSVRLYLTPITVRQGCGGGKRVVDLFIGKADLSNYRLKSPSNTLAVNSDLTIYNIELESPAICVDLDIAGLASHYIDTSSLTKIPILGGVLVTATDLLKKIGSVVAGAATGGGGCLKITPSLVDSLRPLLSPISSTDSQGRKYFPIDKLNSSPANWDQTYIRGDVQLKGHPRIAIVGKPPAY